MESAVDALDSAIWIEPGNTLETCDEAEHAMRALCELRPEQRQVIELGCLHGLTHAEISDRLRTAAGHSEIVYAARTAEYSRMPQSGTHGLPTQKNIHRFPSW